MTVRGIDVKKQTQCAHYHSERDIVAIRFKCCDSFYACVHCHRELAGHRTLRWSKAERGPEAVLCGGWGTILSIKEYFSCRNRCPRCDAAFNPACAHHHH